MACVEQTVEFDSKLEYLSYIGDLKRTGKKFQEVSYNQDETGKVKLRIRKQYNNNELLQEA